jgi:hypothetical protein
MMKAMGTLLVLAVLVSACTVSGPRVQVQPAEVKLRPVTVEMGGGGGFCPPGQAKKGRC